MIVRFASETREHEAKRAVDRVDVSVVLNRTPRVLAVT